jgi:phage-related minor tail protein
MASILTSAIIADAKSSVSTYVSTAQALYDELSSLLANLTGNNFIGDASTGFMDFFRTKATPVLVDNLTEPGSSITAGITAMLDSIKEQLLDTVDPQLGEINRDPTQS